MFPGPPSPSRISLFLDPATQPPGSPTAQHHARAKARIQTPCQRPGSGLDSGSTGGLGVQALPSSQDSSANGLVASHEPWPGCFQKVIISGRDVGRPRYLPCLPRSSWAPLAVALHLQPRSRARQAVAGRRYLSETVLQALERGELPTGLPVKTQHFLAVLAC